jgi:hypothetical protein
VCRAHYMHHYRKLAPPTHKALYLSSDWCKIVTQELIGDKLEIRGVYCFVRLTDGYTKTLGTLTAGDIHKAASWKAPAKHSRGSVLSVNFGRCAGPYGVTRLR